MKQIYLDYNASTPLDPAAAAAMEPLLRESFGNPSSTHWAGRPAREIVEQARVDLAGLLGCDPTEIIFTSGGTESNNMAIKGVYFRALRQGRGSDLHLISSVVEHPAVLEPLRFLEGLGARVTLVGVDRSGLVDPAEIERAITPKTILISLMQANNEVGTIEPVEEVAAIARAHGIPFHTDAAQTLGKIPAEPARLGADLLSVAAHKFYGPKGVGALYLRRGLEIERFLHGAGHESGRRAGTENTILLAGLGAAARAAGPWVGMESVRALRDRMQDQLFDRWGGRVSLNGHPQRRLPNTLSVNFHGRAGADLLAAMPEVAASTGSACHSGAVELSSVLRAMGVAPEAGMGAIRFSLGRGTTAEEIDTALSLLEQALR